MPLLSCDLPAASIGIATPASMSIAASIATPVAAALTAPFSTAIATAQPAPTIAAPTIPAAVAASTAAAPEPTASIAAALSATPVAAALTSLTHKNKRAASEQARSKQWRRSMAHPQERQHSKAAPPRARHNFGRSTGMAWSVLQTHTRVERRARVALTGFDTEYEYNHDVSHTTTLCN